MIRAFIAIPVPPEVERVLDAAQVGLRVGRLVAPENFHLTLAFLDKHPEPVIEDVHTLLTTIRQEGIDLTIDGLGVFGSECPRAIYAAVAPNAALTALRKKIRRMVREGGVALSSEKFVPHITLARFGKFVPPEDVAELNGFVSRRVGEVKARFRADTFALYQSHLTGEGPVYQTLAEYPLQASVDPV